MRQVEIMAPVGSFETLHAALQAGATSVYFGVGKLNMRSASSVNFTLDDLSEIVRICKAQAVKTYLTLNTVMYGEDLEEMRKIIDKAKDTGITAIIACDFAVIEYANSVGVEVHTSTQANVSNIEAVKFFARYADVIVLARELNLKQIKDICDEIRNQGIKGPKGKPIQIEVFIHGALCVSISGKCYMSLAAYNSSANRGACLQNCRREYKITDLETGDELDIGNGYVMSPSDLCTIRILDRIIDAGVSILKIEGRGRKADYVFHTVRVYKEALKAIEDGKYTEEIVKRWQEELDSVYNRGFWQSGYYLGEKIGEWTNHYGSKATLQKDLIGAALHFYPKAKTGFFELYSGTLKVGDSIMITGQTTGIIETTVKDILIEGKPDTAKVAVKGDKFTIPLDQTVRKNDKLYLVTKKDPDKIDR